MEKGKPKGIVIMLNDNISVQDFAYLSGALSNVCGIDSVESFFSDVPDIDAIRLNILAKQKLVEFYQNFDLTKS